ncbi:GerAB/ArcD/ProY family transporter [Paenibacillus mendelii]|uniref:Endospore germination permease n=1 Tax=Paenibacillus mendelii TaxID=206163 RepID=A0ABV6JF44_9BACL|nr:endospore germination permease [Paenibacillus mendelii]MCQ6557408.1 endospore germination permease [Paenibacillus mendelii]
MLDNRKISPRQYYIMVSLYIIGSAILVIPATLAIEAKQDAWIAEIIAVAVGLLILPFYIQLGNRFAPMTFVQYTEKVLGKWPGKIFSLLFIAGFPFLSASLTLRNVGDFMTTQVLPETPIEAIHIFFLCVVILGIRYGLEPVARTAELLFPFVILSFLLLVILIAPQIEFKNILPVMENGMKPVLRAAIPHIAFPFLEPIILILLFPYINRSQESGKALFTGMVIAGVVMIVITVLAVLVLGINTGRLAYPSYILGRKINIGHFLQRIEIMMALIWMITNFIRLTLLFYISAMSIAQTFKVKDFRFLTFPLAIIIFILSIETIPNSVYLQELVKIWPWYALTFALGFPLLLLGVAVLRKK